MSTLVTGCWVVASIAAICVGAGRSCQALGSRQARGAVAWIALLTCGLVANPLSAFPLVRFSQESRVASLQELVGEPPSALEERLGEPSLAFFNRHEYPLARWYGFGNFRAKAWVEDGRITSIGFGD